MLNAIIAIIILYFAGKYLLFHPKVNSIVFLILIAIAVTLRPALIQFNFISGLLLFLNVVDCIHDFVIANDYYDDISDNIDSSFAIKSLSIIALILLGWFLWNRNLIFALLPRAIFICLVFTSERATVKNDVNDKMIVGYPLPYNKWLYNSSKKICYHYNIIVKALFDSGALVANVEVVEEEFNKSNKKLEEIYPKRFIEKVFYVFNKEEKEKIKQIKNKLSDTAASRRTAYISSAFYEQYSSKIAKALKERNAPFSPWKIKEFIELKELNLTVPNGQGQNIEWSEYFIIKSLKQLVEKGVINDYNISDNPLDNHVFGVHMKSRNLSNDPRFAIEDDD